MEGLTRVLLYPAIFLIAGFATGQGMPFSALTGKVVAEDGTPLPQVVVRADSPGLQGHRETLTSPAGDYFLDFLPPGDYSLTFSRAAFQAVRRELHVGAAVSLSLDVTLRPEAAESVAVSAESPSSPPREGAIGASFDSALANALPLDRTLRSVALLAPGVNENGPKGNIGSANERPAIMISGAFSYDNLFLVNGVVVNENLRGQPQDLFIEDSIQETRVQSGRVSAEYGRFTGGVVDAISRSGGNAFHGSFRTTFTNGRWMANDAYDEGLGLDPRVDEVSETYEASLGGRLWRDRIWFFAAGRKGDPKDTRTTRPTPLPGDTDSIPIPYVHEVDETRLEGKLTAAISPGHSVIASYIDIRSEETNFAFNQNILDLASLVSRSQPQSLLALSYNGVLSPKLFAEAQYSRHRFSIEQPGTISSDLILGTRIFDVQRTNAGWNSPQAPDRTPEIYDSDSWLVKGTYFLSHRELGSHEIRAGYERYQESTALNSYFTGSDFRVFEPRAIIRGERLFPVFDSTSWIEWHPLLQPSPGSDLVTHSVFVNDRIAWNRHWSFNAGLRWDKNRDRDGSGIVVSRASSWSPRLFLRYDPLGDGRFEVNAGYGKYVSKLHNTPANAASPAGQAADLEWFYRGPCINCVVNAPTSRLIPADQALRMLFDWFATVGGVQSAPTKSESIPGISTEIAAGGLRSPNVKEYSVGVGAALGGGGYVKADFLYRDFDDLYNRRTDLTTGRKTDPFGRPVDIARIENSNRLDRRYEAIQAQFQYRFGKSAFAGGGYTWSRLTGNFAGENRAVPATVGDLDQYPEYKQERWNFPTGYLSARGVAGQSAVDQRHRAHAWIGWDFFAGFGEVSITVLESYDSGLPYEAAGVIDPRSYVVNPGYAAPPSRVVYFFSKPASYRTDDITRTDVAVNCSLRVFKSLELFIRPEILNLFNERGVVAVDTTVLTAATDVGFKPFNPFTDAPVRGTSDKTNPSANYDLGPNFGKPTSSAGYQPPRTFRLGVGLRF